MTGASSVSDKWVIIIWSKVKCGSDNELPWEPVFLSLKKLLPLLQDYWCFFRDKYVFGFFISCQNPLRVLSLPTYNNILTLSNNNLDNSVNFFPSVPKIFSPTSRHYMFQSVLGGIWAAQWERYTNISLLPKENILKKLIAGSGEEKYTSTSWQFQGNSGSDPNTGNTAKKAGLCGVMWQPSKGHLTD